MVKGFHVGLPEVYIQVVKESTSEHWHFTALQLRERIICVGYMFLINRRYCGQTPTIIFQKQIQGGSNMTGTDLYVNKPHCAAAVRP